MPYVTAIIGFGRIAAGYSQNPAMARTYRYASHIQALQAHPAFSCDIAVDTSSEARDLAETFGITERYGSVDEIKNPDRIDIAVLATPPSSRQATIDRLPNARALVVEKPLGPTMADALSFADYVNQRKILVQINFWRRADITFRRLAAGELAQMIGKPQAATCIYGNGILNNALHMVDFCDMLLGPLAQVQAMSPPRYRDRNPIPGDPDLAFAALTEDGIPISFMPVDFDHYRENAVEIWGTRGKLSISTEGLVNFTTPRGPHRGDSESMELTSDQPVAIGTTAGDALWHLYDNLAGAIAGTDPVWCDLSYAIRGQAVIEAAIHSAHRENRPIQIKLPL